MDERTRASQMKKLFTFPTLILCLAGLGLNMLLANLVKGLGLPLYIDNVGSVLVAVLGGAVPGMMVGFLSNLINAAADPISMYYGILTILNALVAAQLSKKGVLHSWKGWLLLAGAMMVIGGACGSVMTWFLYGGGIGGIAAPLANRFLDHGFSEFFAQFTADMCVDVPDKLLTVLPVALFLRFMPKRLYPIFPYSDIYNPDIKMQDVNEQARFLSVNFRIMVISVMSAVIVSGIAVLVSINYYQEELLQEYETYTYNAASLIADEVDGDQVETYLAEGTTAPGYEKTMEHLLKLQKNLQNIMFIYVYQFNQEGYRVVFDLDTETLQGYPVGQQLSFGTAMEKHKEELLAGESLKPMMLTDAYGKKMSAVVPIQDSKGHVVAYGCADVSMESYVHDMLIFFIKMLSILFGASLCVCSFVLWYASYRVTNPINIIVELSRKFEASKPQEWLESDDWKLRQKVTTHDEIEDLYNTVCSAQERTAQQVARQIETEQKLRASYELERQNKELERQVRRADEENLMKSEFYSRMSHDMRTPMNGIIGLVNLSKEETDLPTLKDNIEKIGMSSHYLLALINDTLDMSKIESQKMQLEQSPVNMEQLLGDIRDMIGQTIHNKKIQYIEHLEISHPSQYLLLDEVRVKQIFMNLFSNAVKFTPYGGIISLDITDKELENENTYHIVLSDTGCGMSSDFINNRLFRPFEQERNNITITSAGSGLGLSIVKNLVEQMGGTIRVESRLDEGSSFIIDLSFTRTQAPRKEMKKSVNDLDNLEGKKVLLCEDHPLNAEIVNRLLAKVGVCVDHARDGQQGVQLFEHSAPGEYAAILMDVRMPVMDGIQAAKKIRGSRHPDASGIPIIAMTANAYTEDRKATRDAGMNAHLSKPIEPKVLYQTLSEYVG